MASERMRIGFVCWFPMPAEPSPSCPASPMPQVQTYPDAAPSVLSAMLKLEPADTLVTPVRPTTATGELLQFVVPSPSCPLVFPPQAQTVLSALTAREWQPPAATAMTLVRFGLVI